jgi:hypothetical protein
MQFARRTDDVVDRVALAQTCSEEHALDVDVDRNIAPGHVVERDSEVAGQDLDRHGGFLLADAIELLEPGLKGPSGRPIGPEAPYVAIELLRNATRRPHDPARPDRRIAVRHRPAAHRRENTQLIAGHPHGIEVTKALMQCLRRLEGAFCGDPLIKQDREKQREWVSSKECLGGLRRREPPDFERAAKLENRTDHVRLPSKATT